MKYKHIIWDWNGTLYNDVELCLEITNSLLKQQKIGPLTLEKYRETLTHPMIDFYRGLIGECDEGTFSAFSQVFHNHYQERRLEAALHSGGLEVLEHIKSKNIPQSILSAHPQNLLSEIINLIKIESYFHKIRGADDHLAGSKVDNGIALLKEINIKSEQVVIIGDTDHDAHVAKSIGINCILIASGFQSKKRLQACKFPVLDSITELPEHLSADN